MRIARLELLAKLQREYHRANPWRLSENSLYVPHSFAETTSDHLTYWYDFGFILGRRRVIVLFKHPRYEYRNAINDLVKQESGPGPDDGWGLEGATKNYKKVGKSKSRKKLVSYTLKEPSKEWQEHRELKNKIRTRLNASGIDFTVSVSWKRKRLKKATSISLVAPIEVHNEKELIAVAALARKLLLGQTTLQAEFPNYTYGRDDWLRENSLKLKAI